MGHKHSEETKRKMSIAKLGKTTWNKGLTKETDARVAAYGEKTRGNKHYMFGKTHSKETKRKMGLASKGNQYRKGSHHSKETRQKMSEAHKKITHSGQFQNGEKHRYYGKTFSEEHKAKIREARLRQILPKKDTSIEVAMQKELDSRGIVYEKHLTVCGVCKPDIVFSDKKIAIQCDGDYWHNLPKRIESDRRQDKVLRENGWHVLRFWEHEINDNVQGCVDEIVTNYFSA